MRSLGILATMLLQGSAIAASGVYWVEVTSGQAQLKRQSMVDGTVEVVSATRDASTARTTKDKQVLWDATNEALYLLDHAGTEIALWRYHPTSARELIYRGEHADVPAARAHLLPGNRVLYSGAVIDVGTRTLSVIRPGAWERIPGTSAIVQHPNRVDVDTGSDLPALPYAGTQNRIVTATHLHYWYMTSLWQLETKPSIPYEYARYGIKDVSTGQDVWGVQATQPWSSEGQLRLLASLPDRFMIDYPARWVLPTDVRMQSGVPVAIAGLPRSTMTTLEQGELLWAASTTQHVEGTQVYEDLKMTLTNLDASLSVINTRVLVDDLASGLRGSGPLLRAGVMVHADPDGETLYLVGNGRTISVDIATGARAYVGTAAIGSTPGSVLAPLVPLAESPQSVVRHLLRENTMTELEGDRNRDAVIDVGDEVINR